MNYRSILKAVRRWLSRSDPLPAGALEAALDRAMMLDMAFLSVQEASLSVAPPLLGLDFSGIPRSWLTASRDEDDLMRWADDGGPA